MKKSTVLTVLAALMGLLALSLFISCQKAPTESPSESIAQGPVAHAGGGGGGQNGTTLSATVTANCVRDYDWTVAKSIDPSEVTLAQGECADVTVTVDVDRTLTEKITGEVCVTNGGGVATTDLHIEVTVLCQTGGGPYQPCFGPQEVDVSGNDVLAPGESACYSYSIDVTFSENTTYKVNADVTITNHSGHLGTPFGPHPDSPSFPACAPTDACATVTDACGEQTGFSCTVEPSSLSFTDAGSGQFTQHICNESAACGQTGLEHTNTAELEECDSHTIRTGTATLTKNTGECPPGGGCTLTQGFWKTHPEAWCVDELTIGGTTYSKDDLLTNLAKPDGGNAVLKLSHQLIAAMLNIACNNAAPPPNCDIDAASELLNGYDINNDSVDPDSDLGQQMTAAADCLDQYNNGNGGVPHCQ